MESTQHNHQSDPDRRFIDMGDPDPPKESPINKKPDEKEPIIMAVKKKKRTNVDAETRSVAVARVNKLVAAGNPAMQAIAKVAKEIGVSGSAISNWRKLNKNKAQQSKKTTATPQKKPVTVQVDPLSLAFDILQLANHAKSMLSPLSRKRLLSELQTRLS